MGRNWEAASPRLSAIRCKPSAKISEPRAWTTTFRKRTHCSRSTRWTTAPTTRPPSNPLSGVVETLREQVVSLQEQHVFSPTLLNTARVGFSRAGYFFTGTTPVDLPGWVAGDPIGAMVIGGGTASNGASQISLARHQCRKQSDCGAESVHLRRSCGAHARHSSDRSGRVDPAHSGQRQPGAGSIRPGVVRQPGQFSAGQDFDVYRGAHRPRRWAGDRWRARDSCRMPSSCGRTWNCAWASGSNRPTAGTRRTDAPRIMLS